MIGIFFFESDNVNVVQGLVKICSTSRFSEIIRDSIKFDTIYTVPSKFDEKERHLGNDWRYAKTDCTFPFYLFQANLMCVKSGRAYHLLFVQDTECFQSFTSSGGNQILFFK